MSRQAEVRRFPGYGVVYPDGKTGIKVVHTFCEAPHRYFNPDGSVGFTAPPPIIHEVFGGGFVYADGSEVRDIKHLEAITDMAMKRRALDWFNSQEGVSKKARQGIPEFDPNKAPEKPETVFVLSSGLPEETDPLTKGLRKQIKKAEAGAETEENPEMAVTDDVFGQILNGLSEIKGILNAHDERLKSVEAGNTSLKEARKVQASKMKEKWLDPAYREKMKQSGFGKKKEKVEHDTTQSTEEVQKV